MALKVLLLEDQDIQRKSIKDLLENILPEPEIITADTYDSANYFWENGEWDFVVLDINIKSEDNENSFDGNSLYEEIVKENSNRILPSIVVRYTGDINVLKTLRRSLDIIKKGDDDQQHFETFFSQQESNRFEEIKNELHSTGIAIDAINGLKGIYEEELELAYPEKVKEFLNQISNTVIFKNKYTLKQVFPIRLKKIMVAPNTVIENLFELKNLLESPNWNLKLNNFLTLGSNYDVLHASVSHNEKEDNWGNFIQGGEVLGLNQLADLLPELKRSGLNLKTEILKALYRGEEIPDDKNLAGCPPWKNIDKDDWMAIREDFKADWKSWNKDEKGRDGSLKYNSIAQKLFGKIKSQLKDTSVTLYYKNFLSDRSGDDFYIFRPLIDWFVERFTLESLKVLNSGEQAEKKFFYLVYKLNDTLNITLAHNGIHPSPLELQNFLKDERSSWYNFQELKGWAMWELWVKDFEDNDWKRFVPNAETPVSENSFEKDIFTRIDKEQVNIITNLKFEKIKL